MASDLQGFNIHTSHVVLRLMNHLLSPANHSTIQQGGNKDKNDLFSLVCTEYNKQSPCHALDESSSCAAISYDKQRCHCPQTHGTGTHLPWPAPWKVSSACVLAGGSWASLQAGEGTPLKHALVAQASPPGEAHTFPKVARGRPATATAAGPHKAFSSQSQTLAALNASCFWTTPVCGGARLLLRPYHRLGRAAGHPSLLLPRCFLALSSLQMW